MRAFITLIIGLATACVPHIPGSVVVRYEPTPAAVVRLMRKMAHVGPGDVVVDLRAGDNVRRTWGHRVATPVASAYALLDRLHLDGPFYRLRRRVTALRRRGADPAGTRNIEAADEAPHDMVAGVQQMLQCLARRYPMSTISTGTAPRVERFLEHYQVRQHFAAVVGAQTTRRMKPHPEPLLHAAIAIGVPQSACLMIGDTVIDMRTGLAAGAQTVGVLCGFGTEGELCEPGAHLILPTTSDLLALVLPSDDTIHKSAEPGGSKQRATAAVQLGP